jgi:membrane associated rhomboid family serine protease
MTPWTTRIIIANVVVFLMTLASPHIISVLVLIPAAIITRPWTLVTYMFVHADFWHIAFNMLGLVFFGSRLEAVLGANRFLRLYFISGISGGMLSFVFTPYTAILGASGAVFGILYGFAHFWPHERLFIWGIIPVEARWMVVGMTLLALFGGFGGWQEGIAHFAHLGGFIGGFLYLKTVAPGQQLRPEREAVPAGPSEPEVRQWMELSGEGLHEVNREELQRIQEKIRTSGAPSLIPREIEFLKRFSER